LTALRPLTAVRALAAALGWELLRGFDAMASNRSR
jgi:hypothetical protein